MRAKFTCVHTASSVHLNICVAHIQTLVCVYAPRTLVSVSVNRARVCLYVWSAFVL